MTCRSFNIRVYGLLINNRNEVLLTDEKRFGTEFTKFPGGGLKKGEGMTECLKREFREELGIEIEAWEHFYTTDFFQASYFDQSEQIISVYYKVSYQAWNTINITDKSMDFSKSEQIFRWVSLDKLNENELTFPIDKHVVGILKS